MLQSGDGKCFSLWRECVGCSGQKALSLFPLSRVGFWERLGQEASPTPLGLQETREFPQALSQPGPAPLWLSQEANSGDHFVS